MRENEVVITGAGVVTPCGIGIEALWSALLDGRSGVDRLSLAANADLPVTIGGEIRDFTPAEYIAPRKRLKLMCREMQTGYAAAALAMKNAGIDASHVASERLGVVFGGEIYYGPIEEAAGAYRACLVGGQMKTERWGEASANNLHPLYMLQTLPNMCACHIAIGHDARGPCNTIVSGDISSLLAVIEGSRLIQRGAADVVIAGGTGSRINTVRMAKHDYQDLSKQDDPQKASRPFDARRDGAVMGEGAGAVILESRHHAHLRNAEILARVAGHHCSYLTHCKTNGRSAQGVRRSILSAMANAETAPNEIGHVNAHGTSMVGPDRAEAHAIHQCLGDTPVTAPKSFFGSLGAGSGAVELAVSVMAVAKGIIPPTLNYEYPDPDCPVNVVREPVKPKHGTAIVLNHTPFGQFSAVLIAAQKG